jgi:hypothetical protein
MRPRLARPARRQPLALLPGWRGACSAHVRVGDGRGDGPLRRHEGDALEDRVATWVWVAHAAGEFFKSKRHTESGGW